MSLREIQEERRAQLRKEFPDADVKLVAGTPEAAAERKVVLGIWTNRNFLGYVKYNFVTNEYQGVWGTYNDRKVETKVVEQLIKSFKKGIHSTNEDTAVPVLMRRSWIGGLVAMETKLRTIGQVPWLKMTEEGCEAAANGQFCPHGGRHRNTASGVMVEEKTAEVDKLRAELTKVTAKKGKLAVKEKKQGELKAAIQRLEREIANIPLFMLKMIDKGEQYSDEVVLGRID